MANKDSGASQLERNNNNNIRNSNNNGNKLTGGGGGGGSGPSPSFDTSLPLNVTIQYGAHAHLVCRVHDVSNKSVREKKNDGTQLASELLINDLIRF